MLRTWCFLCLMLPIMAQGRMIETVMGEVQVPDNAKRIVVLTNEGTEALVALGVIPVGAAKSWKGDPWYPHLADALKDTQVLGLEHNINIELIAALQPDLILANKQRHSKIYPLLNGIAPTVFSEFLNGSWQDNFVLYAEALGLEDKSQFMLTEYQQEVINLKTDLGSRTDKQVSLVRFLPGQTRLYLKDTFAGNIINELGFARPPAQDKMAFMDKVGKERIADMDGDLLFYYTFDKGDGKGDKAAANWLQDPLWRQLRVVQNQQVFRVDDIYWNLSGSLTSARAVLEDIRSLVL